MLNSYDPINWYWKIADQNQVWSSARVEYVPLTDATYQIWLSNGNLPTPLVDQDQLIEVLNAVHPTGSPQPLVQTKFSSLEFLALFTIQEQVAIVAAGQSNPAIMLWLLQLFGADYIDITDLKTVAGLNTMVTDGLLTSERVKVILAA